MLAEEIVAKIREQRFPYGSYIVFGSGPLAAAGIRLTQDIDIVVTPELYADLKSKGWKEINNGEKNLLYHDVFEASITWDFGDYHKSLPELLKNKTLLDGVPFVNLSEVKRWKQHMDREQDREDIDLITRFENNDTQDFSYLSATAE